MRFPYTARNGILGSEMPRLSLTLQYGARTVTIAGLIDSGASVNVLPYQLGLLLGANWNAQTTRVQLAGTLGRFEARGLELWVTHPQLTGDTPVELVFAWSQAQNAPLLFGQFNFLELFDVCLYGSERIFDVKLKG